LFPQAASQLQPLYRAFARRNALTPDPVGHP
jgi:hypothetical protein